MGEIIYITPQTMFEDSFALADDIWKSGFKPDVIVPIWRGGAIPGLCIDEYFSSKGINLLDYVIKVKSYNSVNKRENCILFFTETLSSIVEQQRILLVDDIFDTGWTMKLVIEQLQKRNPLEVKTAAIWHKPDKNEVGFQPDYVRKSTEANTWVVFPHEGVKSFTDIGNRFN